MERNVSAVSVCNLYTVLLDDSFISLVSSGSLM